MRRQHATIVNRPLPFVRLQHHGPCPIAEEHAGAAIIPIENAGKRFRADDESGLRLARLDKIVGGGERKDEAAADRLQVEGSTPCHADARLDHGCRRGKGVVGCRRRQDEKINLLAR